MRRIKEKRLRKQWLKMPESQDVQYDIKGRVIKGITFRQFKKLYSSLKSGAELNKRYQGQKL